VPEEFPQRAWLKGMRSKDRKHRPAFAVGVTNLTSGVLQPSPLGWNTQGVSVCRGSVARASHCVVSGSGDGPKYHRAWAAGRPTIKLETAKRPPVRPSPERAFTASDQQRGTPDKKRVPHGTPDQNASLSGRETRTTEILAGAARRGDCCCSLTFAVVQARKAPPQRDRMSRKQTPHPHNRHPRASGDPVLRSISSVYRVPACAGMTTDGGARLSPYEKWEVQPA
jgi:hypothetical protein